MLVLKDHTRAFAAIFEKAQERLRMTFGVEMVELATRQNRQQASQASRRGSTGLARLCILSFLNDILAAALKTEKVSSRAYMLRNIIPRDERESLTNWGDEQPNMVLLCIILGIIHVNGRRIEEGSGI